MPSPPFYFNLEYIKRLDNEKMSVRILVGILDSILYFVSNLVCSALQGFVYVSLDFLHLYFQSLMLGSSLKALILVIMFVWGCDYRVDIDVDLSH